jgi:hypothetical protein
MAGRPRKPTAVLEMSGAYKKNPGRAAARGGEPTVTDGIGEPPDFLLIPGRERELGCWREIVSEAHPGVLSKADRIIVEIAARMLFKVRISIAKPADIKQLESCLVRLGMTPIDRSRVNAKKDKSDEHNPWREIAENTA